MSWPSRGKGVEDCEMALLLFNQGQVWLVGYPLGVWSGLAWRGLGVALGPPLGGLGQKAKAPFLRSGLHTALSEPGGYYEPLHPGRLRNRKQKHQGQAQGGVWNEPGVAASTSQTPDRTPRCSRPSTEEVGPPASSPTLATNTGSRAEWLMRGLEAGLTQAGLPALPLTGRTLWPGA